MSYEIKMPILINENYYKLLLSASLVHPKLKSIIPPGFGLGLYSRLQTPDSTFQIWKLKQHKGTFCSSATDSEFQNTYLNKYADEDMIFVGNMCFLIGM